MTIVNRNRFPDVRFLQEAQMKPIGDVEGITLILVGYEQGTNAPVVAKSYTTDYETEDLHATPLYELLNHTFGAVNITEDI